MKHIKKIKHLILIIAIVLSGILFIVGCKKENNTPVAKQLDYITHNGEKVYEFHYKNDTITNFSYQGSDTNMYDFDAIYKNGKIHQYNYPDGSSYVEFIYNTNNDSAWLVYDGNPETVYAMYHLNSKGRVINSEVYSEEGTLDLKFYYNDENVTRIDVIKHTAITTYGWYIRLEYDNNPNPWYDLNTLDDYRSFSKNNITLKNGYTYNSWEYDDGGYPVLLNSTTDGQFRYYYK